MPFLKRKKGEKNNGRYKVFSPDLIFELSHVVNRRFIYGISFIKIKGGKGHMYHYQCIIKLTVIEIYYILPAHTTIFSYL